MSRDGDIALQDLQPRPRRSLLIPPPCPDRSPPENSCEPSIPPVPVAGSFSPPTTPPPVRPRRPDSPDDDIRPILSPQSGREVRVLTIGGGAARRRYVSNHASEKDRRCLWILVIVFFLVVAGVLGGVPGWLSLKDHDHDADTVVSPSSGSVSSTAGAGTKSETGTSETSTKGGSAEPTKEAEHPTIGKESRVVTFLTDEHPWFLRIVVFVNADGDLASAQMTDDELLPVPVQLSSTSTEERLRKPLPNTPLHLFTLGQLPSNLHLLYVDEHFYLCLISMTARETAGTAKVWSGGRIDSRGEDGEWRHHQPTEDLRIAYAVSPVLADDEAGAARDRQRVIIFYQSSGMEFTVLSTSDPRYAEQWTEQRVAFSAGAPLMQSRSSGLVAMPVFQDDDGRKQVDGMRILFDASRMESGGGALGPVRCRLKTGGQVDGCRGEPVSWKDMDMEKRAVALPKPLDLDYLFLVSSPAAGAHPYIISVLDAEGTLTELYHDGTSFAQSREFVSVGEKGETGSSISYTFQSIASTPDGLLYGIADGRLLWFRRAGEWWRGEKRSGWELVSVVDSDMAKYKDAADDAGLPWEDDTDGGDGHEPRQDAQVCEKGGKERTMPSQAGTNVGQMGRGGP